MRSFGGFTFILLFIALVASHVLAAPIQPRSAGSNSISDCNDEVNWLRQPRDLGSMPLSISSSDAPTQSSHRLLFRREDAPSVEKRSGTGNGASLAKRNGFVDFFKNLGSKIKSGFQSFGNKVKEGFQKFGGKVKEGFQKFGQKVKEAAHKVGHAFKQFGNKVKETAQKVWHKVKEVGHKIKEGVQKGWAKIKEVAKHVGGKIKEGVGKAVDWVKKNGAKIGKFALKIGATIAGVASTVSKFIPIPGLNSALSKAFKGVAIGANAGYNAIKADMGWQLEKGSKIMDWVGSPISTAAKELANKTGIKNKALEMIDMIV